MSTERIYVIKRNGSLVNVSRGLPSYELDTVRKTLDNLSEHGECVEYETYKVRIPHLGSATRSDSCIWKYDSNSVEFRVAKSDRARTAFNDCLRITDGNLDGSLVLAVYGPRHIREYELFKTVGEAFAGDEVPTHIEFVKAP